VGDDLIGGDPAAIDLFDAPDLFGPQPVEIAVNVMNNAT